MAGTSLLVLIDDIAAVLDDVAVMTKLAARKTAGVLGDDLALNAQQVTGVRAERELPVVWAVAKGSFRNKLILVPGALAISAVIPWLITPLLMLGGLFLCYEGFEKIAHKLLHSAEEDKQQHDELMQKLADPSVDLVAFEQDKIKGAIRTDFILSAEIIVITLGTVANVSFGMQAAVVSGIALLMTVGVYGLVAAIVKLDDAGFYLVAKQGEQAWPTFQRWWGERLLAFAPWLMKALAIVGTAAMFLVGGGILLHGFHGLYHQAELLAGWFAGMGAGGALLAALTPALAGAVFGLVAGGLVVGLQQLWGKLRGATSVESP